MRDQNLLDDDLRNGNQRRLRCFSKSWLTTYEAAGCAHHTDWEGSFSYGEPTTAAYPAQATPQDMRRDFAMVITSLQFDRAQRVLGFDTVYMVSVLLAPNE